MIIPRTKIVSRAGLRRRRRRHKPTAALNTLFKKAAFFDIMKKIKSIIYKKTQIYIILRFVHIMKYYIIRYIRVYDNYCDA